MNMEKDREKELSLGGLDEMSGYLHKRRGGFGKHMPNAWQPRYFIVRDGWMYYFEDKKLNARPRGKIDLQSELVTLVVNLHFEHSPTPHTMLLNPGGYEEKWRLCAANSKDMEQWCACIKSHINNKQKRKTQEINLPAYDSDNDHEDVPDVNEDGGVMIDRLPQAPPSLSSKSIAESSSRVKRKKRIKSDELSNGPVVERAATDNNDVSSDTSRRKSFGQKLKLKVSDNGGTDTTFEIVLTLLLANLCALYAVFTDRIGLSALYFVMGNIIAARTLYLFSERIDKLSKEAKSLSSSKEKLEYNLEKNSVRLKHLEELASKYSNESANKLESDDRESESSVAKGPPAPGTTIQQVFGVPPNVPPHTWQVCDHSTFNVRQGPNYSKFKRKGPTGPAIYEAFAVDTFCARKRIDHIAQYLSLPDVKNINTYNEFVPPILMIQLQLPSDAPPLFGTVQDGPGWAIVMYFKITEWACNELRDLSAASPAIKLFAKFCQHAETDYAWRSRFKVITYCSNLDEIGVPSVISSYNAKPVIIRRTSSIFRGPSHLEIDIHIHKFANLAKKSIHLLSSHCGLMYMQIGFVVEGRTDEELPENLFACVGVNRPDEEKAEFLFDDEDDSIH